MSALSKILRDIEGGGLMFRCPGCNENHAVWVGDGTGPRWGWNGDVEKPTFTPSVLVRNGHYLNPDKCWCKFNATRPDEPPSFTCKQCHSFVTDGQIQFLSDCSHALAGQTVPLPDFN
jgi:hypothetical protein